MKRPLVLVDVDGVLRDLVGGFCQHLSQVSWRTVTPSMFKEYAFSATLDPEEIEGFETWTMQGGYRSLRWYPGSKELLFWLRGAARVVALTAAYEDQDATRDFLAPYISNRNVLFSEAANKHTFKADVLIEDYAATAVRWADSNPAGLVVLIDRPWNRAPIDHERVVRATSYAHAREILNNRLVLKESA